MEKNQLSFQFYSNAGSAGECASEFILDEGVITTQDIAERTNYKLSGGQYILPHLPVEQVAYGPGRRFIMAFRNYIVVIWGYVSLGVRFYTRC